MRFFDREFGFYCSGVRIVIEEFEWVCVAGGCRDCWRGGRIREGLVVCYWFFFGFFYFFKLNFVGGGIGDDGFGYWFSLLWLLKNVINFRVFF